MPERFFLYVGSDYAHKNLRLLMAAYASFRAQSIPGSAPALVVVGHPSGTVDGMFPRLREATPPGVLCADDMARC